MDRRRETSVAERKAIVAMAGSNVSTRDIAATYSISQRTVQRWIRRHQEGEGFENAQRCGAPRRTTREEDERIVSCAQRTPLITAVTVKKNTRVDVGVQTVRKRLHDANLHHRTPATKPFLTEKNREQRLGFALQYYPQEASFWDLVVFCDEKTFASDGHGQLHCWRPRNTRLVITNIANTPI